MRGFALPLAALALSGCGAEGGPPSAELSETAVACDELLASVAPVGIHPLPPRAWGPAFVIGPGAGPPLEAVVGVRWHPGLGRLFIADGSAQRVQVYGSTWEHLFGFGGEGEGPGEFSGGIGHWLRNANALVLFGPDSLLVHSEGLLHVFAADGTFGRRFRVRDDARDALLERHLDPWVGGGVLVDVSAARDNDPSIRGDLSLHALYPGDGRPRPARIAGLRNPQSLHPPAREEGQQQRRPLNRPGPMDRVLGRMWASSAEGTIAMISLNHPGICFLRPDGAGLLAYVVNAPPVSVTRLDRTRFFDERRARYGPTVPMVGGTWEDYYHDFPDRFPPSVDVVFADRATVWVARYTEGGGRAWDVYDLDAGYVGTLEPFTDTLPLTFADGCAITVAEPDPDETADTIQSERVIVWCPAGH